MNLTTAKEPWLPGPGAQLLDAQGNPIASFKDWRDRDLVLELSQRLNEANIELEDHDLDPK